MAPEHEIHWPTWLEELRQLEVDKAQKDRIAKELEKEGSQPSVMVV